MCTLRCYPALVSARQALAVLIAVTALSCTAASTEPGTDDRNAPDREVGQRDVTRDVSRDIVAPTPDVALDAGQAEDAPIDADDIDDGSGDAATDVVGDAEDADAEDAAADAEPDVAQDIRPEVTRPPDCGDGVVNVDEECDDGNENEDDGCTSVCTTPRCGDGVVSTYTVSDTVPNPVVTNPFGTTANVCDEGSFCASNTRCEVGEDPQAPEHGMCQSLGFDRAVAARYGLLPGATLGVRAIDWVCWNYVCGPNAEPLGPANCQDWEALLELECASPRAEQCDEGRFNAPLPDRCRVDCTAPRCTDGIVDSGEECDDGNEANDDGCSNRCRAARCGDGIRQIFRGEECDDGNSVDDDGCNNACELAEITDVDVNLRTATGVALWADNTAGRGDDVTASCGGEGAEDLVFGWVAPSSGAFRFSTCGFAEWDTVLSIRTGARDSEELACDDNACGQQSSIEATFTAGEVVYLFVDGASGASGAFAISIEAL